MAAAQRSFRNKLKLTGPGRRQRSQNVADNAAPPLKRGSELPSERGRVVDLRRCRNELTARIAELQFDLGGLVYEMAIRNQIRVDLLVRRAAVLQEADSELNEVQRILRLEETATAGACPSCGAPHSSGAAYCWQCGQPILPQVPTEAIAGT